MMFLYLYYNLYAKSYIENILSGTNLVKTEILGVVFFSSLYCLESRQLFELMLLTKCIFTPATGVAPLV